MSNDYDQIIDDSSSLYAKDEKKNQDYTRQSSIDDERELGKYYKQKRTFSMEEILLKYMTDDMNVAK